MIKVVEYRETSTKQLKHLQKIILECNNLINMLCEYHHFNNIHVT